MKKTPEQRINGILKQEFLIDRQDITLKTKKCLVANNIKIYNQIRPHLSNQMWTPNKMHHQKNRKTEK